MRELKDNAIICFLLAIAAVFGVCALKGVSDQADASPTSDAGRANISVSARHTLTAQKIDQLHVGQRVWVERPETTRDESIGDDVDPATWRKLVLRSQKRDGSIADIELLRPETWLVDNEAAVGGQVYVKVPECGIDSWAEVLDIQPCPQIQSGPGRVVTGTFHHSAHNVVDVFVQGQDKPIGATGNHPFWSQDRQDFVRADQLREGERLRTLEGLAQVVAVIPRAGPEPVFNLEVQVDHVYHVASSGILVHNGTPCPLPPGNQFVDLSTPARRTHILDGDATGGGHSFGTGIPGKTEFPQSWSDDRIMHAISDIATDPSLIPAAGRGGRSIVEGIRDGVRIRVVLDPDESIVTGFPLDR
jgi:Bacterial EndoU nuclease/Pretoxin HINT domain